jgi:hypothetical protein
MDISTTTLNFEMAGEVQLEYMAGVEERARDALPATCTICQKGKRKS